MPLLHRAPHISEVTDTVEHHSNPADTHADFIITHHKPPRAAQCISAQRRGNMQK